MHREGSATNDSSYLAYMFLLNSTVLYSASVANMFFGVVTADPLEWHTPSRGSMGGLALLAAGRFGRFDVLLVTVVSG